MSRYPSPIDEEVMIINMAHELRDLDDKALADPRKRVVAYLSLILAHDRQAYSNECLRRQVFRIGPAPSLAPSLDETTSVQMAELRVALFEEIAQLDMKELANG